MSAPDPNEPQPKRPNPTEPVTKLTAYVITQLEAAGRRSAEGTYFDVAESMRRALPAVEREDYTPLMEATRRARATAREMRARDQEEAKGVLLDSIQMLLDRLTELERERG